MRERGNAYRILMSKFILNRALKSQSSWWDVTWVLRRTEKEEPGSESCSVARSSVSGFEQLQQCYMI
jgi:hypothetical protein